MEVDRTELHNLIGKNEPLTQQLIKAYEAWAHTAGVLDWRVALPRLQALWQMNDVHG